MANQLAHFAIHADDLERARQFYGGVFGWVVKFLDTEGNLVCAVHFDPAAR